MDVERCIDGTVSGEKLQELGHVEGTLDFAVSVPYDDGVCCDRLLPVEGEVTERYQVGSREESTYGHRDRAIPRFESERSKAVSR